MSFVAGRGTLLNSVLEAPVAYTLTLPVLTSEGITGETLLIGIRYTLRLFA